MEFTDNAIDLILQEKDHVLDEKNEYNKIICDLTYFTHYEDNIFLQPQKKNF